MVSKVLVLALVLSCATMATTQTTTTAAATTSATAAATTSATAAATTTSTAAAADATTTSTASAVDATTTSTASAVDATTTSTASPVSPADATTTSTPSTDAATTTAPPQSTTMATAAPIACTSITSPLEVGAAAKVILGGNRLDRCRWAGYHEFPTFTNRTTIMNDTLPLYYMVAEGSFISAPATLKPYLNCHDPADMMWKNITCPDQFVAPAAPVMEMSMSGNIPTTAEGLKSLKEAFTKALVNALGIQADQVSGLSFRAASIVATFKVLQKDASSPTADALVTKVKEVAENGELNTAILAATQLVPEGLSVNGETIEVKPPASLTPSSAGAVRASVAFMAVAAAVAVLA